MGIHGHTSVSSDKSAAFHTVVHDLFSVFFKLLIIPTHHFAPGQGSLTSLCTGFP